MCVMAAPPPLLTGCILKQRKILHQNTSLLDKNFQKFSDPPLLFRPLYFELLDPPVATSNKSRDQNRKK